MHLTTISACFLAICSGVFYYQEKEKQIDDLQHEVEIMQKDQIENMAYVARLTGLLRHHHIKYGEINAQRK